MGSQDGYELQHCFKQTEAEGSRVEANRVFANMREIQLSDATTSPWGKSGICAHWPRPGLPERCILRPGNRGKDTLAVFRAAFGH